MGLFSELIDAWQGLGQANAMHKQQLAYVEWQKWRAEMFDFGWAPYDHAPPKKNVEVLLMRHEWPEPVFTNSTNVSPETNVHGLMWKPWTGKSIEIEATKAIAG